MTLFSALCEIFETADLSGDGSISIIEFWTILDDFRPFWQFLAILTIFGDFDNFDHFHHFGPFWIIWDHFGPFWTILDHFDHVDQFLPFLPFLTIFYLFLFFFLQFSYSEFVSGRFDTSGFMIPRLVPEISPLDAFCEAEVLVVVGIGDSRSWIYIDSQYIGKFEKYRYWYR